MRHLNLLKLLRLSSEAKTPPANRCQRFNDFRHRVRAELMPRAPSMATRSKSSPVLPLDRQAQTVRLERQLAAFRELQRVAHSLTSELRLDQLLSQILESAVEVVGASAGSLLLFDPQTDELVFRVVLGGAGEALRNQRIASHQGIAGWAWKHQESVIVHDPHHDSRFFHAIDEGLGFKTTSLIVAPLVYRGTSIGVVEALNKKSGEKFDEDDQELLMAFAAQSAIAIQNAQLYQELITERDRILAVEEQVRRELARDLHDGPLQLLSAVIMGLQFLKGALQRQPDLAPGEVAKLEKMSAQALQQVRNMQFTLRPLILETQGLRAAIEFYVERQRAMTGLAIHLDAGEFTARFAPRAEAAIFSILQEAIGNALKHASPNNIWVTLRQDARAAAISVQDDGLGFDMANMNEVYSKLGSMGLLNIRERAQIAGGKLTIASQPGKGTMVTVVVPRDDDAARSSQRPKEPMGA